MGYAEYISGRPKRDHDRVLRVRVYTTARSAQIKRIPEERRARRLA